MRVSLHQEADSFAVLRVEFAIDGEMVRLVGN